MALYTRESIDRLRETIDMVELVGARTDLRRVGSRWVGLCPFHDERTPSFSVNAESKLYYCFGCEAKGDAIGFVRETEALDFREAVEFLADRYGVELELESEDPRAEERRRRRERLLALLDRTARFYATFLWDSAEAEPAREYLLGRGLKEEVLREFRVGYAPSAWDRVVLAAQRDGFTTEELAAAGLGQTGKRGGLYDRFRGRVMFPLADGRGRVLGFGARALRESQRPKYLNTSENELYHKGRQLFGIDLARAAAAKAGRVLVVEGYTDVLALHQAGIGEAVAIMGTALTQEQLSELARAAGRDGTIFLALDADRSGHEAMLRAARGARDQEIELRVVELPEGKDPAELVVADGAEAMNDRVQTAVPVLEFEVRRVVADGDLETPSGRDRALLEAQPLIEAAHDRPVMRDHLVRLVADRIDVPVEYVTANARPPRARPAASEAPATTTRPPIGAALSAERAFLALCAGSGELGRGYLERLSDEHLFSDASRRARDHLLGHFDDPLADLPEEDPSVAALVTGVAMDAGEQETATDPVLRMSFLQLEMRRIDRAIRHAGEQGDLGRQDELSGARQDVRREMDLVMGQTA
ncbi:MAG: DNA primase [Thermoleophilaceae bacterium]